MTVSKKISWTRTPPSPPESGHSDWYWLKRDEGKEMVVTEVWPNRCYWPDGWWGPQVKKPTNPPKPPKKKV